MFKAIVLATIAVFMASITIQTAYAEGHSRRSNSKRSKDKSGEIHSLAMAPSAVPTGVAPSAMPGPVSYSVGSTNSRGTGPFGQATLFTAAAFREKYTEYLSINTRTLGAVVNKLENTITRKIQPDMYDVDYSAIVANLGSLQLLLSNDTSNKVKSIPFRSFFIYDFARIQADNSIMSNSDEEQFFLGAITQLGVLHELGLLMPFMEMSQCRQGMNCLDSDPAYLDPNDRTRPIGTGPDTGTRAGLAWLLHDPATSGPSSPAMPADLNNDWKFLSSTVSFGDKNLRYLTRNEAGKASEDDASVTLAQINTLKNAMDYKLIWVVYDAVHANNKCCNRTTRVCQTGPLNLNCTMCGSYCCLASNWCS